MNNKTIKPDQVHKTLEKHLLVDGLDLVFDMKKSQGVYLFDSKRERKLLDFFTCFASVPLGYNHPKMIEDESFKENLLLAAIANPSNSDIYTTQFANFVETFSRVGIPSYLPHAFFISGGTLAIENALKVAMDWKVQKNIKKGYKEEKGTKVIHFEKAFHGRSGYTLSLTNTTDDKTRYFAKFDWPRVSTPYINFPISDKNINDLKQREEKSIAQIKQAFIDNKDEICAIIIEPILSEGGDLHIRQEFLEKLRQLADEHEAMLIYDEIQTGVGLTGKFWCHEHFGENARPDILAFGKKMQICGILVSKRVDEIEENVFKVSSRINSTWGGNLADMVRSNKILQIIEEDKLLEKAKSNGAHLQEQLSKITSKFPILSNVRGRGLMCAFDFPDTDLRNKFLKKGLEKNVLFLGCGPKSIRFRPALTMEKEDINLGMKVMEEVLTDLQSFE